MEVPPYFFLSSSVKSQRKSPPPFLGSLTRNTGRCSPPAPPIVPFLFLLAKIIINRENPAKNTNMKKIRESVPLLIYSSIMLPQDSAGATVHLNVSQIS